MELDTPRWLEFGVTSGLLITIVVYLLKWHIPALMQTFEQGFSRVALALKDVNTQMAQLQKRLDRLETRILDRSDDEWREHARECRQLAKESSEERAEVMDGAREIKIEIHEMKQRVQQLLEAILKIL